MAVVYVSFPWFGDLMNEKVIHISRSALGVPPVEIPSPPQQYNIQRRGARVRLGGGRTARLHLWDVMLIDLSISGVLIEHTHRVRVGDLYSLSFQIEGLHVKARARAVRSFVSHRTPVAGGERQLVFRTGMEFADLTAETAELISAHLGRLRISELRSPQ